MNRIRISTTVDGDLLTRARTVRSGVKDATLIDEALEALLARERTMEIDASYAAYDTTPLSTEDEWGNPEAFLEAMRKDASRPR